MAATYQTLNDVFTDVRFNASKDATTLPDADLLRIANKYYMYLFRELADLNEAFYTQIAFTDIKPDQREYPLPVDNTGGGGDFPFGGGLTNVVRVEVSYDGGATWAKMKNVSLPQISGPTRTDADLNRQFSKSTPVYWFFDRSVFIAPVPSTDDVIASGNSGLFIWYVQRPKELETTTDIPEMPKDYLNGLAEGMMIDVFRKFGRISDMRLAQDNYQRYIAVAKSVESNIDLEETLYLQALPKRYT